MRHFETKLNLPLRTEKVESHWVIFDSKGTQLASSIGQETAFELATLCNTLPGLYEAAIKELRKKP